MNPSNLTIKSQETLQRAQQLAFNNRNPNIETEHLLFAMLSDDDSPIEFLLKKNNVNVKFVEQKVSDSISKLPVMKEGEPAQIISRDLNNVMLRAASSLKTFEMYLAA